MSEDRAAAALEEDEAKSDPTPWPEPFQAAANMVFSLCQGAKWTMTVPVKEDRDSDTVIMKALRAGVEAARERDKLRAAWAKQRAHFGCPQCGNPPTRVGGIDSDGDPYECQACGEFYRAGGEA